MAFDKLKKGFNDLIKKKTDAELAAEAAKKREDDDLAAALAASLATAPNSSSSSSSASSSSASASGAAATTGGTGSADPAPKKSLFSFLDRAKGKDKPKEPPPAATASGDTNASPAKPPKPAAAVAAASYDAVKLLLSGGATHASEIVAKGYPTAAAASFRWYRASAGGRFDQIDGAAESRYQPTVDDVGARICCQWVPTDGFPSNFAEWGPVKLDPAVLPESEKLFATGQLSVYSPQSFGSDSAKTAPPPSERKSYTLHIDREQVLLEALPAGDISDRFPIGPDTRIRVVDAVLNGWHIETTVAAAPTTATAAAATNGSATASASAATNSAAAASDAADSDEPAAGSAAAAYALATGASAAPAPVTVAAAKTKHSFSGACESARARDVLVYLIRRMCEERETAADIVHVSIELADASSEAARRMGEAQLRKELLSAQQDTATARNETQSARKKLAAAQSDRDSLSVALKQAKDANDKERKERDSAWEKKLNDAIADSKASLSAAAEQAAAASSKPSPAVQQQLKELEKAKADAVDDLEHMKKTLRSLTEQLAAVSQRDGASKFQADTLSKENKALKDAEAKFQSDAAAQRGELAVFKAQCRDLTSGNEGLRRQVSELDERLKKMTQSDSEARGELLTAKSQLAKYSQQSKDLESLQRENERLAQELHQTATKLTLEKELTAHLTSKSQSHAEDKKAAEREAAELSKLRVELDTKTKECDELKAAADAATASRTELDAKVTALTATLSERDAAIKTADDLVTTQLQPKLADAQKQADDYLTQKNHWKRKADSLQQQVAQLLAKLDGAPTPSASASATAAAAKPSAAPNGAAGGSGGLTVVTALDRAGSSGNLLAASAMVVPSTPPSKTTLAVVGGSGGGKSSRSGSRADGGDASDADAAAVITRLEKEKREALAAVDAYRKAFEQQLAKSKTAQQSAALATSQSQSGGGADGYFGPYQEMKKLANSLSETITDKDLALSNMKNVNRELGKRIRELETIIGSSAFKLPAPSASASASASAAGGSPAASPSK